MMYPFDPIRADVVKQAELVFAATSEDVQALEGRRLAEAVLVQSKSRLAVPDGEDQIRDAFLAEYVYREDSRDGIFLSIDKEWVVCEVDEPPCLHESVIGIDCFHEVSREMGQWLPLPVLLLPGMSVQTRKSTTLVGRSLSNSRDILEAYMRYAGNCPWVKKYARLIAVEHVRARGDVRR